MTIIDNLEKIKSLLEFREGIFYYIQVIQRKKENPSLDVSDIKRYQTYITSKEDLDRHFPRIMKICKDYCARAYISVIPRSLEKLTKACALEYVKRINSGEYKRAWDIPNRLALSPEVRAKSKGGKKPLWMLDIDNPDDKEAISKLILEKGIRVAEELPTLNGYHLLVETFNPSLLADYKKGEDYVLPDGERFTFRQEANTILFAVCP